MENRDPALCRAFVKRAKELFQDNPRAKHSWSVDADEDHCILDIPEQAPEGFSVTVQAFADEIILSAGGAHCHFDAKAGIESCVETVLGLVRDLLSPQMRVRELRSNNRPYRWYIEVWTVSSGWRRRSTATFSGTILEGKQSAITKTTF